MEVKIIVDIRLTKNLKKRNNTIDSFKNAYVDLFEQ